MSFSTCVMQQAGGGCTMQHNTTQSAESAQAKQLTTKDSIAYARATSWRDCSCLRNPANETSPVHGTLYSHCCILPA